MDSVGYYVEPTVIQVTEPMHQIMQKVCLHVKQLILILSEHWLSSKQTKLSSRITCPSLTLLGVYVCVSCVHPVLVKCRRSVLAVYVYPEKHK